MSETTPVAPAPPVPPPKTPEDELEKKRAALKIAQADVTTASQNVASLQNEVTDLQAKVTEIQQTQAGYEQTSKSQQQQLDDDKSILLQKRSIAEAVLKELTKKIDGIVDDFDKALGVQAGEVEKAGLDAEHAAKDAQDAKAVAKVTQAKFDTLKKLPASNDSKLKDIESLLAEASSTETQSDFVAMYFWTGEAQKISDVVKIPKADEYDKQVRSDQDAVDKTKADEAGKELTTDKLLRDYTDKKQKLDSAQQSRRTDILAKLKKVQPEAA